MRRTTRNNIRQAENQGITIREGKEDDVPIFYQLLKATSQRRQFKVECREYYMNLWRLLEPTNHVKLFMAEYEGEVLSSLLTIPFGKTVVAKRVGWIGTKKWLRPNELLFWQAIKWSMENGFEHFDLDCIDLSAALALLEGNRLPSYVASSDTQFKLGFGGSVELLPATYEYISSRVLRLFSHASVSLLATSNLTTLLDFALLKK